MTYWFGPLTAGFADPAHRERWFVASASFDAALTERFTPLVEAAPVGELDDWCETPRGRLAFVLVCDQLPRNIYRGTARAFATDRLALKAARDAVRAGVDLRLAPDERGFLYLPFEHSEDVLDQHLAVGLFTALRDASPKDKRDLTGGYLRSAQQHRDLIVQFGRFPHRNAILGRGSTPAEAAYLEDHSTFGQTANADRSSP
ncbi:MAG: DUF924 family protein [Pseudomonadales bacterium]|nr:DUF924 domain-containing protein [Pseudomonadales bacterium]NIX09682.1 DUF924 family protein [Pseudomonadales bacterium]